MVIIKVQPPNPDGLDEIYHAYHVLRDVLKHAELVPNPVDEYERPCAESAVEEAIGMLEWWIVERSSKGLEAGE